MIFTQSYDPAIISDDIAGEPFKDPVGVWINEFSQETMGHLAGGFNRALDANQKILPVIIDSYGGVLHSALAMCDIIEEAKTAGLTVITCGAGAAMSAGALLLAAGTPGYRYALPSSAILVHGAQVSSGGWSDISDAKNIMEAQDRGNKSVLKMLDSYTGRKAGYWEKKIKDHEANDIFLTSEEAKKERLIDKIGMPKIHVSISRRFTIKD